MLDVGWGILAKPLESLHLLLLLASDLSTISSAASSPPTVGAQPLVMQRGWPCQKSLDLKRHSHLKQCPALRAGHFFKFMCLFK